MPKGPNGQKRPADLIGAAVMVGRIATGDITDTSAAPKGAAGGKARAEMLAPEKRSEIASLAAKQRWQGKGIGPMQTAKKQSDAAGGRDAVRMYSNNSLIEPVREFGETFSGFDLLKKHFTK